MTIEFSPATPATLPSKASEPAANTAASDQNSIIGGLTSNLDVFLKILTTQLTNQNPLNPLDTDKFTSQLTEFASVEQTMGTNTRLDELKALVGGQQLDSAINYVGKDVNFIADSGWHDGQGIDWEVTLPGIAKNVGLRVLNEARVPVFSTNTDFHSPAQRVAWDGTQNGTVVPEGRYTLEVTVRDTGGQLVSPLISTRGRVNAAEVGGTHPSVLIGNMRVPLSDVTMVATPEKAASAP